MGGPTGGTGGAGRGELLEIPGFPRVDGVLTCGGVPLDHVAEEHGTPLYIYDLAAIEDRVQRFQRAFEEIPFLLAYSVKANGALALLNRIAALGAGADIVSAGELQRALLAGVSPEKIVFAGVGKTSEEMEAALEAGIRAFHVESVGELELLAKVAAKTGRPAPISLRVNPDVDSPTPHHYTRTGHAATKFGIPVKEAEEAYLRAMADPHLQIRGIDVHIGSQIVEAAPYLEALDIVLDLVDRLVEQGVRFEYLDLGGGFGVGYDGEPGMDLDALAAEVIPRLQSRGLSLMVEPGRSIVGEAGVLLTEVLYLKESGGKIFVVTDAGMTELLRPSHYGGFHRIVPVRFNPEADRVVVDVVGPICETGDFLALDRPIARPAPGDLLAIGTAGAYGFVMASNYNARRRPAEIMIEGGEALLIRERESVEDLIRGERVPEKKSAGRGDAMAGQPSSDASTGMGRTGA
jgi:diaminopimelate decarboxylase